MNRIKPLFLLLALLPALAFLSSFGVRGKTEIPSPVVVTGVLRLVGNEPFSRLIVTDDEGRDYLLQDADTGALRRQLGKKLRVKGLLQTRVVKTADGRRIGEEFILSQIETEPIPEK